MNGKMLMILSVLICSFGASGCTSNDDEGQSGSGGQGGGAGDAAVPTIQDWIGKWDLTWGTTAPCSDAGPDIDGHLASDLQRMTISAADGGSSVHLVFDPIGGAEADGTVDTAGNLHAAGFSYEIDPAPTALTVAAFDASLVMKGAYYNFDTTAEIGWTGGCTSGYSLHGQP